MSVPDISLHIRDQLRDLFALLDIQAQVNVNSLAGREVVAISVLSVGEAKRLAQALDRSEATRHRGWL